ncbi:MAG: beta/gamma crystallin-related protein, partial [Casimicrobiaceae bacterium]
MPHLTRTAHIRLPLTSLCLCACVCAFANAAFAQSITFFEREGFAGRQLASDQWIPDFDALGMNDAANSVIVRDGQWEICTDANFQGRCTTLVAGEYPNLGALGMSNSISSARRLDAQQSGVIPAPRIPSPPGAYAPPQQYPPPLPAPRYDPPAQYSPPAQYAPAPGYDPQPYQPPRYVPPRPPHPGKQQSPVVLYDEYDFGGSSTAISSRVDNLDITQWNDRAVSMVISEGNWELCTDAYYRGACNVFGPGSYRDLGNGMVRQISSIRPARERDRYAPGPGAFVPPDAPVHAPPRAPRAIL